MNVKQCVVRSRAGFEPGRRPEDDRAFNLIELLVVLGVIGMLALLALPALARTGTDAKVFQCCNNLRQWARAMQMYASENLDTIPRDGMGYSGQYPDAPHPPQSTASGSRDLNQWFNRLPPLMGEQPLYKYTANAGASAQYNSTVIPFPGGVGRLYECPSAWMTSTDLAGVSGQGAEGFFSYGMNIDLKGTYNPSTGASGTMPYPKMPKTTALPKPSATVFMFDMAFNPREWPYANTFYSVNPAGRWRVFPMRHCNGQGGVLSFVDGHSKYFKWSYVFNQQDPNGSELILGDIIWNPQYRAAYP